MQKLLELGPFLRTPPDDAASGTIAVNLNRDLCFSFPPPPWSTAEDILRTSGLLVRYPSDELLSVMTFPDIHLVTRRRMAASPNRTFAARAKLGRGRTYKLRTLTTLVFEHVADAAMLCMCSVSSSAAQQISRFRPFNRRLGAKHQIDPPLLP